MPRYCSRCNRPLDAVHHDIAENKIVSIVRRGRGRVGLLKHRVYGCKVRLVATSPVSGKTFVPNMTQRISELDTRYVHEDRFQEDLKP